MIFHSSLVSAKDLEIVDQLSATKSGAVIYKHSTRCPVSSFAKRMLEGEWHFQNELEIFYLDLIAHRDVSNEIEAKYGIRHESPQILMIVNGECVASASHSEVNCDTIEKWLHE